MFKLTADQAEFILEERGFPHHEEIVQEVFPDLSQTVEVETPSGERFLLTFKTSIVKNGWPDYQFWPGVTITKTKL